MISNVLWCCLCCFMVISMVLWWFLYWFDGDFQNFMVVERQFQGDFHGFDGC